MSAEQTGDCGITMDDLENPQYEKWNHTSFMGMIAIALGLNAVEMDLGCDPTGRKNPPNARQRQLAASILEKALRECKFWPSADVMASGRRALAWYSENKSEIANEAVVHSIIGSAKNPIDDVITPVKFNDAEGVVFDEHGPAMPGMIKPISSPRALLRPLTTAIWDSEIYDYDQIMEMSRSDKDFTMTFFQRPIGTMFAYSNKTKTERDASLVHPAMLANPFEMAIRGFNVYVNPLISDEEKSEFQEGKFDFSFSGTRRLFQQPLINMPWKVSEAPVDIVAREEDKNNLDMSKKDGDRDYHDFVLGKNAFRVLPGEAFGVSLSWNRPPKISRRVKIWAFIECVMWTPL